MHRRRAFLVGSDLPHTPRLPHPHTPTPPLAHTSIPLYLYPHSNGNPHFNE
jgi:hypothetical protein